MKKKRSLISPIQPTGAKMATKSLLKSLLAYSMDLEHHHHQQQQLV